MSSDDPWKPGGASTSSADVVGTISGMDGVVVGMLLANNVEVVSGAGVSIVVFADVGGGANNEEVEST